MAAAEVGQSIVLDPGGDEFRVGFAGEDGPRGRFPAMVERRPKSMTSGMDLFVGDDAYSKLGILQVARPMSKRSVDNWDELEKIMHYAVNYHTRETPSECGFIFAEPPLIPKPDRERMIEMILEDWFQSTYFLLQQTAALYSMGRTIGIVLDSGFEVTHCVPIYEYAMPHAIQQSDIGGKDVSLKLCDLLSEFDERAQDFFKTTRVNSKLRRVCGIKHDICFVKESTSDISGDVGFELPDGNVLKVPKQMVSDATEWMFAEDASSPDSGASAGVSTSESTGTKLTQTSITQMVRDTKSKMDTDLLKDHSELASQIMIVGGNSLIPGFSERVRLELELKKAIAPIGRDLATWLGCSIFSSLSTSKDLLVSKQEYQESGKSIVHRKF